MLSWEKLTFSDTVELRRYGVYIDVSQTKHGIMQEKTSDYMPRVNTKLVNCNLKVCPRTILSLEKHTNIMETIKTKDVEF